LREQFDASFGAPPPAPRPEFTSFIALRLFGDAFAIRVREVSGLAASRTILPLPGSAPALLGLSGIRELVVPVFSLGLLMGYPSEAPRWLLLCPGELADVIALGFGEFEGYIEASDSEVRPDGASDSQPPSAVPVREYLPGMAQLRGVIEVGWLLKKVYATVAQPSLSKER
jgi:chemotaxis signal transduction protein